MKRFVAAMASILALGFAGTAAAAGGPDARGEADPFSSFHGVTAPYSGLPGGVDGVVEDEKPRKSGSTQDRGAAKEAPASDAQEAPAKDASPESSSEAPKPRTQQAEEAPAPAKADAKADAKAEGNEGRPAEVRPAQEENTNVEFFPGLPDGGHAAYGTGSVIHTDELQSSQSRLVNVDAAFAGASFSSDKLSANILSENARIVAPILDAGNAFGRGSGLEAGLNQDASGENQIQLPEKVEAKAPPSTELKTASVVPDAEVEPVIDAELLRGDAQALGNAACTTGVDLSFGLGHASDLGLINMGEAERLVGTDNPQAPPAVSQSRAATRLVKQSGEPAADGIARFGLQTEVQQIIAPVTLFQGTPNQVTLNFLGTWTLRVTADGKEGSVFYGPGDVEPETIVLQVLQDGEELLGLRTQDLLGEEGLNVQLPEGLLEIAIGENPRAIGEPPDTESEPTETATVAAAAVDVVRVRLLDVGQAPSNLGVFSLGDLRVGHMEAAVQVPEGGIPCGIELAKTANPQQVTAGEQFTWDIRIGNPNDCVLTEVKLVDTIEVTEGILYKVISQTPKADSNVDDKVLTWNDLGPIDPGGSTTVQIKMEVDKASKAGLFTDNAVATGLCGPAEGTAGAENAVKIPLEAKVRLELPKVTAVQAAVEAPLQLPVTGGEGFRLMALAMAGLGTSLFLRRAVRKHRH